MNILAPLLLAFVVLSSVSSSAFLAFSSSLFLTSSAGRSSGYLSIGSSALHAFSLSAGSAISAPNAVAKAMRSTLWS
jgi:hypothetical protein